MEYRIDGQIWYGGVKRSYDNKDFCGKDCYWRIEGDTLKIRGSGDFEWVHKAWDSDRIEVPNIYRGMSYRRVVIEEGIKSIDDLAFEKQPVEEAELPSSLGAVAEWAFYSCDKLRRVRLKRGITAIKENAFAYCKSLTEIAIPEGVISIEEGAFQGCRALTSIRLPNSLREIGEKAFRDCDALTDIVIPDGVRKIGDWAFDCKSLKSIVIPDGVRKIGEYTFAFSGLMCIVIPSSVKEIGKKAFGDCFSLTRVIFCGTKEQWKRIKIADGNELLHKAKTEFGQGKEILNKNIRVLVETPYRVGKYITT